MATGRYMTEPTVYMWQSYAIIPHCLEVNLLNYIFVRRKNSKKLTDRNKYKKEINTVFWSAKKWTKSFEKKKFFFERINKAPDKL